LLLILKSRGGATSLPGDVQTSLLADLHGGNTLIPACQCISRSFSEEHLLNSISEYTFDDSPNANIRDESAAANGGIESDTNGG